MSVFIRERPGMVACTSDGALVRRVMQAVDQRALQSKVGKGWGIMYFGD